jgi:hypothetical protein
MKQILSWFQPNILQQNNPFKLRVILIVRRAGFASRVATLEIFTCSSQAATRGSNPSPQCAVKI